MVQEAVHGCYGKRGFFLAAGNLVRFIPQCKHLGRKTGKVLSLGCGQGGLYPAFPLKKLKTKFIFHGAQSGSGRGWGQIETFGGLYEIIFFQDGHE